MIFEAAVFDQRGIILCGKLYFSRSGFTRNAGDESEHEISASGNARRCPYVAVLDVALLNHRYVTEGSQAF